MCLDAFSCKFTRRKPPRYDWSTASLNPFNWRCDRLGFANILLLWSCNVFGMIISGISMEISKNIHCGSQRNDTRLIVLPIFECFICVPFVTSHTFPSTDKYSLHKYRNKHNKQNKCRWEMGGLEDHHPCPYCLMGPCMTVGQLTSMQGSCAPDITNHTERHKDYQRFWKSLKDRGVWQHELYINPLKCT